MNALRHRDFRLLVTGTIVDQIGSWAYNVALAVYVYSATHSAAWIGAASAARFIPPLLFGTYAGRIAERFERTRVIVVTSMVCAALMIGLVAAVTLDAPVALALVIAAANATAVSVLVPVSSALVPDLVDEPALAAANGLTGTVAKAAVILGPAAGAWLLLLGDPSTVFLLNAATFLFSAEMVLRIRTRSRPVDVAEGAVDPLRQMLVGLRQIRRSPGSAVLIGYGVLAGAIYGADTVLFVVVSQVQLGTGPEGFGYLLAGLGVGGVVATVLVNRLASSPRLGAIIAGGMAVYCLPIAALAWVHVPAVAFMLQVVRGGGTLVVGVLAVTALQRSLTSDVIARVLGVFPAPVLVGMSVGALITPPLLSAFGLRTVLLGYGLGVTGAALAGYPKLRQLDQAALARVRRLEPRIALLDTLAIFARAPRPVLERLAGAAKEFAVAPGTAILREGEPADALYVLEIGEVAVSSPGAADSSAQPRTLNAPGYFGEIGLIERLPRTASVKSLEKCKLLRIEGPDFLDAMTSSPASYSLMERARAPLPRTSPPHRPLGDSALAEPSPSRAG